MLLAASTAAAAASARASALPVVAVTAYDDPQRHNELMAAGCNGYFVKPLDVPRLLRELVDDETERAEREELGA